ncbi:hypothetical protein CWI37_2071p0010 [Hamiltosporidium tvaerminnensis]|uniref:Uncharacterized protein n=1 Tax=Hamiltosporidium tvaerminnensis TaxID=1176355 RepID=A0A4V2JTV7_9MICR|nr:hypothetical protein CWI37_2071p0010 [Hamiltosporidium tvaerminnensis]
MSHEIICSIKSIDAINQRKKARIKMLQLNTTFLKQEINKSDKEEFYNNSAKGNIEAIEYPTLEETITVIMSDKLSENIHQSVKIIWRKEKIAEESNVSLLIPLHKQSAQMKCGNNMGKSPLNTGYKILSKIVAKD